MQHLEGNIWGVLHGSQMESLDDMDDTNLDDHQWEYGAQIQLVQIFETLWTWKKFSSWLNNVKSSSRDLGPGWARNYGSIYLNPYALA